MTDLRQAAQQALEALETCGEDEWHSEDDFGMVQTYDEDKVAKGVTALRTALEQAEPPPEWLLIKNILNEYGLQAIDFVAEWKAAQQPRKWVGLTDEDVRQCSQDVVAGGTENSVDRFAYAIEAKLRSKNDH